MSPGRQLLVDQYVLDGIYAEADPARLALLLSFLDLLRDGPTNDLAAFLDDAFWQPLWERADVNRAVWRRVGELYNRLTLASNPVTLPSASLAKMPGDIGLAWRQALHSATAPDPCESWRSATVVVPRARENDWTTGPEAEVQGLAGSAQRSIVVLEDADNHQYFNHDVDPWIYHGHPSREARRALTRPNHPQCLPKPEELLGADRAWEADDGIVVAMREWVKRLDEARARKWIVKYGTALRASYIPSQDWSPTQIPKVKWRTNRVFEHDSKYIQMEARPYATGPIDWRNQVWSWDTRERHWDVQDEDPNRRRDYVTVSHTGRVLKVVRDNKLQEDIEASLAGHFVEYASR